MNQTAREIKVYKEYFWEFYNQQLEIVQQKIDEILGVISLIERVPAKFLKHIEGSEGLYEIRVMVGNNIFRIFSCFDKGKLIILVNGFQKKTDKTPKNEIRLAERLMKEYFTAKQ